MGRGLASPSGQPPTALHSPPSCPAASHAKDNSNSPGPLLSHRWRDGQPGLPADLSSVPRCASCLLTILSGTVSLRKHQFFRNCEREGRVL